MKAQIIFTRGVNFATLTIETGRIYDIRIATGSSKVSYTVNCAPSPLLPKLPATKTLWQAWELVEADLLALSKEGFGTSKERALWWKIKEKLEAFNQKIPTQ